MSHVDQADLLLRLGGQVPPEVEVREQGLTFSVSLQRGQKTGWFFDQAANRDQFLRYVPGRRVLDVCSYVGAWGVRAAAAGAQAWGTGSGQAPGQATCTRKARRALPGESGERHACSLSRLTSVPTTGLRKNLRPIITSLPYTPAGRRCRDG